MPELPSFLLLLTSGLLVPFKKAKRFSNPKREFISLCQLDRHPCPSFIHPVSQKGRGSKWQDMLENAVEEFSFHTSPRHVLSNKQGACYIRRWGRKVKRIKICIRVDSSKGRTSGHQVFVLLLMQVCVLLSWFSWWEQGCRDLNVQCERPLRAALGGLCYGQSPRNA